MAEKKRKREPGEEDIVIGIGQNQKNVIEIQGKSCLHEVAWPPGAFQNDMSLHARLFHPYTRVGARFQLPYF